MDRYTEVRSEQSSPSVAKTRLLTQSIRSDFQTLLTQFEEREAHHAREVSEWYARRQNIIDSANALAREVVDKATKEMSEYTERVRSEVHALKSELEREQRAWEEEKKRLACTQRFEPHIKLDVGGVRFSTSMVTLRRYPDTMIGTMFSGRHALPLDETNHHFIDRDGTHFRHILNFLRDPEHFILELPESQMKELKAEVDYYGLTEYMFPFVPSPEVRLKCDISSTVISRAQTSQIHFIRVVQESNGMWLGALIPVATQDAPPMNVQQAYRVLAVHTPIVCCTQCSVGYVVSGNVYFGARNFLHGRALRCPDQPLTTAAAPCKVCGRYG